MDFTFDPDLDSRNKNVKIIFGIRVSDVSRIDTIANSAESVE